MPSPDVPIIIGYYRWTDIWYQWCEQLDYEHKVALKAILAHDAIVHEDHPLHPGRKGIDLFLGTFETGEARLLMSSKQVDYVRYWAHAVGLTQRLTPLPYSDCLLTESNLKTISPIRYNTGFALKNAIKDIEKNNKRLKGSNPQLSHRRDVFERVRKVWQEQKGVWFALDFEAWERDSTLITEFGWSSVRWENKEPIEHRGHYIVEGARMYQNTTFVQGNRDHYNFGESEIIKRKEMVAEIKKMFDTLRNTQPAFLVFHDSKQDLKYLKELGIDLEGLSFLMPDNTDAVGLFVVDTAELIGALLGETGNNRGLQQTCNLLQIKTEFLHNAGNDAHYTLLAMQAMAGGDNLDTQRNHRWPNQTVTGLSVELQPWQEEDDYDDQEGLFGFIDTTKLPKENDKVETTDSDIGVPKSAA